MRFISASILTVVLMSMGLSNISHAAPISGQGSWETTLKARDLDGNLSTIEAFYDATLNITWLADAALSKSETFGVAGIVTANTNTKGRMAWSVTEDWINAMNLSDSGAGYLGQNTWRRPTILDDSDPVALTGYSPDTSRSELASLYFDTLGNANGLTNTADFTNMQAYYYATDTDVASDPSKAWSMAFHGGYQYQRGKSGNLYSFAVLDGDVGAVIATPLPAAVWLLGSGLLGLIGIGYKRRA